MMPMYRNSLTLPIIALTLALLGAGVLTFDLSSKEQPAQGLAVDGKIGEAEYQNHLRVENIRMDLYWTIKEDRIYVGLHALAKGWLAIGFDPEGPFMKGADIVIGYVKDGQIFLQDNYANGPTGHTADTELGSRDDILEKAGSQDEKGTTIEFSRLLDTGDQFDKPIREGKPLPVILAYSNAADFTSYHGKTRALMQPIDFFQKSSPQVSGRVSLWPGLPSHLEAYEIGLVAWVVLLSLFAIQGMISVWLEGRELKVGKPTRASEPIAALLLAVLLALLEFIWIVQFVRGLYGGAPPAMIAIYAALLSFTLAILLLIYRRAFLSAETILQERDDHVPW